MNSTSIRVVAAVAVAVPFIALGIAYGGLPDEIPIQRNWELRPVLWAKKSVLTVFRVPVIGVLTAAAADLMRRHFGTIPDLSDRRPVQQLWLILFVTACVKSLCEGLDLATAGAPGREGLTWFGVATLTTVMAGLTFAAGQLPRALPILKRGDQWKLTRIERWSLVGLGCLYIFFALAPLVLTRVHKGEF